MSSFNKVILLGNLTRDPEVRYTPNDGLAVATLGLAVNDRTGSGDQKKETVSYIDVIVFGNPAEACGKYLFKGSLALVEGKFRQRRWDDKDTGQKRSKIEVVASAVHFMPRGQGAGSGGQGPGEDVPHNVGQAFPGAQAVDDSEIPF